MRKIILTAVSILLISGLFAQSDTARTMKSRMKSNARILFSLNTDMWLNTGNGIKTKHISPGMEVFFGTKNYFGKSPLGVFHGLGISSQNIHYNMLVSYDQLGRTVFTKASANIKYKNNKLSLTYLDIPLELFYSPKKGKGIYISAGLKGGYLLNSHTKYKGNDLDGSGDKIKIKSANIKNVESFRYGITGRIGFGSIFISGYYSLYGIFKENKAVDSDQQILEEFTPFTIGISFLFLQK